MHFKEFYEYKNVKFEGMTTKDEGHKHEYEMSNVGNGSTSVVNDHSHQVINFKVIPAEDTHTHDLEYFDNVEDEEK